MQKRILILCFLHLWVVCYAGAQKEYDLSGWITADLTVDRIKWDYTASLELRTKDHLNQIDLCSIGQYVRYHFSPLLKASAGYEIFFTQTSHRGTILEHRFLIQNESTFSLSNLKIDNRLSLLNDFEKLRKPGWGARERLRLKYPIHLWEPFTYIELYYRVKDKKVLHHKNRYAVGMNYHLNTTNVFSLYYMREEYFQKTFINNVIGISYVRSVLFSFMD